MDYLMIVTAAGKVNFVSPDSRKTPQIVRREQIVTFTGSQSPECRQKRQQLFLTLASPLSK
ncbi:MAG TPA: hypothetical protein VFW05_08570 [Verrucomicrobiae bacterium]|nr:hypothetical protein [Verrucomicrobiae bacterium]